MRIKEKLRNENKNPLFCPQFNHLQDSLWPSSMLTEMWKIQNGKGEGIDDDDIMDKISLKAPS